jgi:uncharacterized protein
VSTTTQDQLETNKALVKQVAEVLSSGDVQAMVDMLHDEGTWWTPATGEQDKATFAKNWAAAQDQFKTPMHIWPVAYTAEGDRVACEMASRADLSNGNTYANKYHILFVLRDGKVFRAREYLDTHHVNDAFGVIPTG